MNNQVQVDIQEQPKKLVAVPDYWRQLDFFNPVRDSKIPILVAGAGATGSYLAYGLVRMGCVNVTVCDFDTVAQHNLPNQFFALELLRGVDDSSLYKTLALKKTIDFMQGGSSIKTYELDVREISLSPYRYIFSCVDKMEIRKYIYHNSNWDTRIIDPRTGGEYANVLFVDKNSISTREYYEATLHTDEETVPLSCTGTAVIDMSFGVSAECIKVFRHSLGNGVKALHYFMNSAGDISAMKIFRGEDSTQTAREITGEHS